MEKIINIFGDSIVYAGYVDGGGWADRLTNYLEKNNAEEMVIYNLGIPGDTTDGLLKRFKIENEVRFPDVIIITIGINDSKYINDISVPLVSLEKFENNLLEIIKQARKFTQEIIFTGLTKVDESKSMPVFFDGENTNTFFVQKNISIYDSKIKEICERNDLPFIEMLDLLGNNDLEDGLHPNSKGHEKMFLRVKDFLVENKIV